MDDAVQVLYVERDLEFARKTAEQLEQVNSQLEVTTVLGSRPAFQALSNDEYDCIVSEYRLPNSTGLELFDQIRRNYPNLPFILFTEHGSESIAGDAVTAGISDYLQKAEADDDYELLADSISNAVTANETVIEATQERRRLEQVLKTVPSCVVQLNRDGQFVFANDRAETVLGLKQAELEERAYNDPEWDIKDLDGNPIPDDELPFARVLYEGEQVRDQHTIRWPDGKKRVLAVNGAPVMNEGSVESVVCSLTDITDRHRRERRLEKLHEATRDLYDAKTKQEVAQITSDTADAILDFELNGVHFYDEQAGGLKPVAVSDRTQRVTDELVTFDHGIAWEAFQSGEIRQYDDIHTADNIYNPESEFRSGLYLPLGEYGILLANSTQRGDFDDSDVSLGQLLAENAKSALDRVERERRLALLQERTSALMQTTTADKTVDLTVGAAAEILGTNLSGFIQEDEREEVLRPLSTTDALAAEFSTYEGFEYGADGDPISTFLWDVYDSGTPEYVGDASDHPALRSDISVRSALLYPLESYGLLVFAAKTPDAFDRTDKRFGWILASTLETALERVDRERLLRDQTQKLTRQNQQLEEFAQTVTHDLRNPLQVLRGTLDGVRKTTDVNHLDRGYRALDRMETLIDDVLMLAQEGQLIDDTEMVSLASLADDCWDVLETADAELIINDDMEFEADSGRVRQLLENLFANAVTHAGTDVTVTVGTLTNGFFVSDDGPGIDPVERDQIFTDGYTSTRSGTGFGLSIVKQIADAHDWDATIAESPSGGAQIEFTSVSVASSQMGN
ncbi:GAF domain-containing protein [Haloarcula marismortui]|uniref:histidine kinase n=1 Tax=Haloarcula marismortui ATCC 33800 TaxID=662476 RepID=A0A8T8KFA8_9EURY|nr:GAF domain-containing protein [Haloarcula sinaiiensis]QUJ73830.1 GAF domain-containing protein [Haloarcula sinaiiensis ATCC 33800]